MFRAAAVFAALLTVAVPVHAQSASAGSIAAEADVLAFGISGYSAIFNATLPNRLQFAFGVGAYDAPSFLVSGDENYDQAQWEARVTSLQVARITYRFRGAMKSGLAVGAVMLNQNWRLESAPLQGDTRFRTLSGGLTAGYYIHLGTHFYLYPTAAVTYNSVRSGSTSISGVGYHVEKIAPNASLHAGWEWGR